MERKFSSNVSPANRIWSLCVADTLKAFLDEQHNALEFIRTTPELSTEEKKRFFKSANTNLGSSALCLSGGGSFGYCTNYPYASVDHLTKPRQITLEW